MNNVTFENEELGVSFSLPEKITVRQHMTIKSRMVLMYNIDDYYLIVWNAISKFIEDWDCELIPEKEKLDTESEDLKISEILFWACTKANAWLTDLESVEKN